MIFVDRADELRKLEKYYRTSRKHLFPLVVMGLRRIGKTRLVLEFARDKDYIYFFVNPNKRSLDLLREFMDILRARVRLPKYISVDNWLEFIEVLFEYARGWIVIFDEFQYFAVVAPEVFGEFQKLIDLHEETPMMLVFVGSVIGMMKDTFENRGRPLYDRVKAKMRLRPLSFPHVLELLGHIGSWNFEDIVRLYMLFGGYPKYYLSLSDLSLAGASLARIIQELFIDEDAPYRNEGRVLLGDSGRRVFYSIIEAIAVGKRKLSDIASYTGIKETQLPQYMDDLIYNLEVVIREKPIDAGPDTRRSLYYIKMPVMEFWFRYLHRYWSLVEIGLKKQIIGIIMDDIETFFASRFEFFARDLLIDMSNRNQLPLRIGKIGRWWRKGHEIDVVATDQKQKNILLIACRWGELSPQKALEEIERLKQERQRINITHEKAHYGVIAKEIRNKETLRNLGYHAIDLKDIEELYRR